MPINPDVDRELLDEPEFRIMLRDVATDAKNYANQFIRDVHRDDGVISWIPRTGHANVPVDVVQRDGGKNVYLVNFDHGAHLQEWGGAIHPPFAPLRRAVRVIGLDLREAPK